MSPVPSQFPVQEDSATKSAAQKQEEAWVLPDADETRRIERVVQKAADTAYAARVQRAFRARHDRGELGEMIDEVQESLLSDDDWERLCRSCRGASREEFAVFAGILHAETRWLATGDTRDGELR